ncbi:uncharacterized protein LOC126326072 [Schistocerca gregaria]|uniref:uncharacterized protein LOC126326072 n=1 Tax=Schistocerca gregaria TaxID=7010 RepID=UPI00211E2CBA|nr:uncharacterized protein LOC126326072 [Schistocerca gregaria]
MELESHSKVLELVGRSYRELPMCSDLQRLTNVKILNEHGYIKHPPLPGAGTLAKLEYIFVSLTDVLLGSEAIQPMLKSFYQVFTEGTDITKRQMEVFLESIGGDTSPVVQVLRAINQSTISPVNIELKKSLGMQYMTKDVKNSWFFEILTIGPVVRQVVVISHKREQSLDNSFQYEWLLSFYFEKKEKGGMYFFECTKATLGVTDLMYSLELHKSDNKNKRREIELRLEKYALNGVIREASKRHWEHYPVSADESMKDKWGVQEEEEESKNKREIQEKQYDNGDRYVGELEKGIRNGFGEYQYYHSGSIYQGYYRNGKRHGKGTVIFKNSSKLDGYFERGITLYGVYTYSSGDVYKGDFGDDKFDGIGKWSGVDGTSYFGQWKAGVPHGQGNLRLGSNDAYSGQWQNGKMHGKGTYTRFNGDVYVGEFKEGKPHGHGKYFFSATNTFCEGEFSNCYFIGGSTNSS